MAIVSNEDLIQRVTALIGENTTDENISLIEDVTDTLQDYTNRTQDSTNWQERYNENDREWRKRYTDRFSNNDTINTTTPSTSPNITDNTQLDDKLTFNSLFKEE